MARGARIEAEPATLPRKDGAPPVRPAWPRRLGALARRNLLGLAATLRPGGDGATERAPPAAEPTPAAWPKSPDLLDRD